MKHPKLDEDGRPVHLAKPHTCTPWSAWHDPAALATAVPGCPMPSTLNGIAFAAWAEVPLEDADWARFSGDFVEPEFAAPPGFRRASGAVVLETDGRVWVVSPSNAFGGYVNTFPKGTMPNASGASLRGNAVREVWEESGLQVRLTAFLCDSRRSLSHTRYYLAERIGGTPAEMGWESQAVHLVPLDQLADVAAHPNDVMIVSALKNLIGA